MAGITRQEAERRKKLRMEQIPELYTKGITIQKMREIFNTSGYKISNEINELIDRGLITKNMIKQRDNNLRDRVITKIQKRSQDVFLLYRQGKLIVEISSILGCSHGTVCSDIARLKRQGKITEDVQIERYKNIESRKKQIKPLNEEKIYANKKIRQIILELYTQDKTVKEISTITGRNISTIYRDIQYMKKVGIISEKKENLRLQNSTEIFDDFLLEYKEQLKKGTLNSERLLTIKTISNYTEKYNHVVFAIKAHIKLGDRNTALELIEKHMNNKHFTKNEKQRLQEMKVKIEEIEIKENKIKQRNESDKDEQESER